MRILALDTSTWWGGVALVSSEAGGAGPRVVAEFGSRVDGSRSDRLLNWIERLLAEAGWPKSSIDAFAVTRGPGSFTGIRVALGTARGLSVATGRPCHGVTTLEALAEAHGPGELPRVPLIDAGRGELYAARYDAVSSPPLERRGPVVGPAVDLLEGDTCAGALLIPGPCTELVDVPLRRKTRVAESPRAVAAAAGRLVALRAGASPAGETPPLAPLYVRPPDAVLKRKRS
jgi:tRNA threonylcarbamoyladenosine biosynthesis protein TsaB